MLDMWLQLTAPTEGCTCLLLQLPRKSKFNHSRNLRDDEAFIVRHFAGAVCYQVRGFLDKNNDALHDSLEVAISQSQHLFVRSLFPESVDQGVPGTKKLTLISVGSKFRVRGGDDKRVRGEDDERVRGVK